MAPRRVHHLFALRVLPEIALDPGTDLFAEAAKEDLGPRFVALWQQLNLRAGHDDYVDPAGLAAYVVMLPELSGVLVTLPDAVPAEARCALVVADSDPQQRRDYTYESAVDRHTGSETTTLGSWVRSAEGLRYVDLGPRQDPSIDGFVNEVALAVNA